MSRSAIIIAYTYCYYFGVPAGPVAPAQTITHRAGEATKLKGHRVVVSEEFICAFIDCSCFYCVKDRGKRDRLL